MEEAQLSSIISESVSLIKALCLNIDHLGEGSLEDRIRNVWNV